MIVRRASSLQQADSANQLIRKMSSLTQKSLERNRLFPFPNIAWKVWRYIVFWAWLQSHCMADAMFFPVLSAFNYPGARMWLLLALHSWDQEVFHMNPFFNASVAKESYYGTCSEACIFSCCKPPSYWRSAGREQRQSSPAWCDGVEYPLSLDWGAASPPVQIPFLHMIYWRRSWLQGTVYTDDYETEEESPLQQAENKDDTNASEEYQWLEQVTTMKAASILLIYSILWNSRHAIWYDRNFNTDSSRGENDLGCLSYVVSHLCTPDARWLLE